MKKIFLVVLGAFLLWGCYTQVGTLREDEGYVSSKKEYRNYTETNDYFGGYERTYIHYHYHLPYPRYYLFFRFYTPGAFVWWDDWYWYDPWDWWWYDWYWWRYGWYPYWYVPYWWGRPIIVISYPIIFVPRYWTDDKVVVYRPRNFGTTRGMRESGEVRTSSGVSRTGERQFDVPPPSRTPGVTSTGEGRTRTGEIKSTRVPESSPRQAPRVGERPRDSGATRGQPPRVAPQPSQPPRETTKPNENPSQPRRTGIQRSSHISRDYQYQRETIRMPMHRSGVSVISQPRINLNSESSTNDGRTRNLGARRR